MQFNGTIRFLAAALLSSTVMAAAGCSRAPIPDKNIVCILVDQLRKDASDRWASRLNDLAARGIVVEGMRSASPWTYPSVISLMSGLYPQQHGADGRYDNVLSTFDESVPLAQKILRSAGYQTSAFITNPFLHEWNSFHVGFDSFYSHFINTQGNLRGLGNLVWVPETMFANSVNETVVGHFDATPLEAPEFTYIHYIDVHGPWNGAPFDSSYEASVRYIDERVAEIYDYFYERYDGKLLFVVTSDHGVAQGIDEGIGHGKPWRRSKESLHDFNTRIPFLILPSRYFQGPRKVTGPCSNIDFVPTLLDWMDIEPPHRLPGISLLAAIQGDGSLPDDRPIYANFSAWGSIPSDSMVYKNKKYMRFFALNSDQVVRRRVFDLERDPDEIRSDSESFEEAAQQMWEAAGTHDLTFPARYDELDPEINRRLRSLGYLR